YTLMKKHLLFLVLAGGMALLASCKNSNTVTGPPSGSTISNPISRDTLSGNIRGTMLNGHTYYIKDSITVLAGDTLSVQPGVTVIALQQTTAIFIQGSFDAEGTKSNPILFTCPASKRTGPSGKGSWGGIRADSAFFFTMKWTRVEYTGGPDEGGSPRGMIKIVSINNRPTLIDIEDCWMFYGVDDGLRIQGGKGVILRNTLDAMGSDDGEAINIKVGFIGDVGHNVVWQPAGNCIKIETSTTDLSAITKVNVFNNTCIASGFRRLGEIGYGTLVDANAQANVFNNIYVNDRDGFEIGPDADTANVKYGNNLFFGTIDTLNLPTTFYPSDGVGKKQAGDIFADPQFTSFDGSPAGITAASDNNDYHLKAGSPALGKGTSFQGFDYTTGGRKAISETDMGAYTSTSSSNEH